jgi:hypothetical protein
MSGFDFVLTSLELMKNEKPISNILQAAISAIEISNSIFNREPYGSDEKKVHPKLKIFISATLKLQQKLRKGLFDCVFEANDASVIIEFFGCKQ